jgi:PHS family inorganic phosphate transporter-like MFS transporter
MSVPGYICSILYASAVGLRRLQLYGFAATAVFFLALSALQPYLLRVPAVYVVAYGLTFFAQNFGPNTTTYIVPSLLFSASHRGTCHGISAAAGKLGALVGAQVNCVCVSLSFGVKSVDTVRSHRSLIVAIVLFTSAY